ncbi:non-ribosomal peptide synthetase [Phytohabitans houttuyneae]|uniref:Carrier domain-containing protein n=1 Tax=Phytohabitans houttuyneae TaxID=1076126 RepID=A0A6V8JZ50_9ACTN|nr:non-ribosomal peptide synthetase [Phytohabitans houttuyneae]GFJ78052.1 hypothetical protein Phou_022320 [Phytohabitans houttuyneae]
MADDVAFDISALELWLPLSAGGRVVVGPDEVRVLPERLATLVERENVTVVQATPTTWRLGLAAGSGWLAGRTALCGGEPMPPSLARQLRAAGCRASNVYGPTETTIWSTAAPLDTEDPDRLTVGQPIANTRAYVLNAWGTPCPTGVTGELCLAGTGVAAGYHDRPELTAERFRDDPALGRYYRTGDLARLLPDGRIELLGRRDRQVKLRGHRIELGEVEQVLSAHDEVAAAAVILRTGPDGDGQLAAYVVAEDRPGLVDDVWAFARSRLPGYSLPARVMVLERLPETANGKVDLLALAGYDAPVAGSAAAPGEVRDPLERRLVDAWSAALGEPDLDAQANFFLYGGSSLLAAQTAEEISAWSDVPVSLGMMLAAPTPAALAALIRRDRAAAPEAGGG